MSEKAKFVRSFILGLVLGGVLTFTGLHFCHHHWGHHSGRWDPRQGFNPDRLLEKFNRDLDLNTEQKAQVDKILKSHLPQMKALREKVRPQFDTLRKSMQSEIRKVLTSEQQMKFDKMSADFEKRRLQWEEKRDRQIRP